MRKQLLLNLGNWLKTWLSDHQSKNFSSEESLVFSNLVSNQHALNTWHSEQDIVTMLNHLGNILTEENIEKWLHQYPDLYTDNPHEPVLVKSNANYSFAAFHELLCCLITQTPLVLNATENQFQILKFICNKLSKEDKSVSNLFLFSSEFSRNLNKYILYSEKQNDSLLAYFRKKKALIIEPKSTVGILTGNETREDLFNFGKDIFLHLGQSPRSLRKIYIPAGFDIKEFISAMEPYSTVYQNNKYANNYDYHQSVYLMNMIPFLDNGFLIFKEDKLIEAPTGCLFYEFYSNLNSLCDQFRNSENIENVICKTELPMRTVKPGHSHLFQLWDYSNKKDLIEFLIS